MHRALEHAHTLQGGPNGIDVLAFGQRSYAAEHAAAARRRLVAGLDLGACRALPTTIRGRGRPPPGRPRSASILPRPERIVNVADVPVRERRRTTVVSDWRDLGRAAGSERTGLRHATVAPGKLSNPPHCHSAEEEIFVVLEGDGQPRADAGAQGCRLTASSRPRTRFAPGRP